MAIAFVRAAAGTTFGGTRTQAVTASVAGNTLVAKVLHQSSGPLTITSAGVTWVKGVSSDAATPTAATGQYKVDIWYALNAPSTTSVVFAASPNSTLAVTVSEFSGVGSMRFASASYTKALDDPGAGGSANIGELVIVGLSYYATTDTGTPIAPFQILGRTGTSTSRLASAYQIATVAGPKTANWDYPPEGSPSVYDRASVMAIFTPPASPARYKIRRNGVDVPMEVRRKTTPAVPVDENDQKIGAGYTPIQSLNLVNPFSLKEAYSKNGNGTILTGPAGVYEESDFSRTTKGMVSMPNTWRGFSGVGKGTVVRLKPGTSTLTSADIPTARDQATNPYYLIIAHGSTAQTWERFTFGPGANHNHGGIQARAGNNQLIFDDLDLFDLAPGNDWTPPGETFGLNAWQSPGGVTVRNVRGDGNNRGSSLIGFNSCRDIVVEDVDLRNSPWGMITFWQCTNFTTRRVKSYGGHAGINQEQVGGIIEHYNPELFPNRNWPTSGANANSMHITFQSNNPSYVASKMRVFDAVNDTGLRNGALMIMKSNNYTVAGGSGQLQQDSAIEVYKTVNGVQRKLTMVDMNNTGGVTIDKDQHFCLFR